LWITLFWWVLVIVVQFNYKLYERWQSLPNQGVICKFFYVTEHIVIFALRGMINPYAYFAARRCYGRLLSIAVPRDEIAAADERRIGRIARILSMVVCGVSLASAVLYTPLFFRRWAYTDHPAPVVSHDPFVYPGTRWLKPTIYLLCAPIQQFLNISAPLSFVAVHALVVVMTWIRMKHVHTVMRVANGTVEPVLDAYYTVVDMLGELMGELRKHGEFDLFIAYQLLVAAFMSVKILYKTLPLEIMGTYYNMPPSGENLTVAYCYTPQEENPCAGCQIVGDVADTMNHFGVMFFILVLLAVGNSLDARLVHALPRACYKKDRMEFKHSVEVIERAVTGAPLQFTVLGIRLSTVSVSAISASLAVPFLTELFHQASSVVHRK